MRLQGIPGLGVDIASKGNQLWEFRPPIDEKIPPGEVRAYVECDAGEFMICIGCDQALAHSADGLVFDVHVDGKVVDVMFLRNVRNPVTNFHLPGKRTYKDGRPVWEPYRFASMVYNRTPAGAASGGALTNLGEIRIVVKQVNINRSLAQAAAPQRSFQHMAHSPVPTMTLNGCATPQQMTYGTGQPLVKLPCTSTELPYWTRPLAVFVFKYRTRQDLVDQGIIPLTAVSLEDRDLETMNVFEAREQLRLLRKTIQGMQARDQNVHGKSLRDAESGIDVPVCKRESTPSNADNDRGSGNYTTETSGALAKRARIA